MATHEIATAASASKPADAPATCGASCQQAATSADAMHSTLIRATMTGTVRASASLLPDPAGGQWRGRATDRPDDGNAAA
jgi:hypothetical protein